MNLSDGQIVTGSFGVSVDERVVHDGVFVARNALRLKFGNAKKLKPGATFRFVDQMQLEFPRGPSICLEFPNCRRLKHYIERDVANHPVFRYRLRSHGESKHIVLDILAHRK